METKLQQEINNVLKAFPEYWNENTLLKNKLIEDVRSYNESLIESLLSNALIRDTYSLQLSSGIVFKVEDFINMLRFKNYWDNSYTKYTNEIGLTSESKYLRYNTDIVLDFPHKDSVLEGGMTKEDRGKKEIYYHNVIAKEEIDTLFSPKVLTNIKKFDDSGSHQIQSIKEKDNLIIKGNNLIALHSFKERYAGKVKLIYIDPPYNTGGDSFKYNDRFNHSTWLTFIKNRLEIAYELLSDDGSIWITLNDTEVHYLKVLCDEIFDRDNFYSEIIWVNNKQAKGYSDKISLHHNTILVYTKSNLFNINLLERKEEDNINYKNPDNDPKGPWRASDVRNSLWRPNLQYNITTPSGKIIKHPENGWRFSKETFEKELKEGKIKFSDDESRIIRKIYLNEQPGRVVESVWHTEDVGTTREANSEIKSLFGTSKFSTTKPEKLLQRIIHLGTNENDVVLDFFMGSASTQAVALKMNRRFIGIEQMDYINSVSIPRLQKVIEGEQGGISKNVAWQGGGSFVYAELHNLNEAFVDRIQASQDSRELNDLLQEMKDKAYLNFKVDLEKMTSDNNGFHELSLKEQKDVLIQVLDMNQLYLNYSEIEDSQYDISDSVKAFNHSFYQKEGDQNE